MRVTQISESDFSVQGHGVHTAFVETMNALRLYQPQIELKKNARGKTDVWHIHTVGVYSLAKLLFSRGKKVVSAHIVPDSLVGSLRGAEWWKGAASMYLRWFYNRADSVLAVSDETKHVLEKLGVRRPIHVLYNMVDTARYETSAEKKQAARQSLGFTDSQWIVIGNGQVQPRKRADVFVDLAKKLPDMTFVWVGGIPFERAAADYKAMQHLMKTAPKNVQFTGVVSLEKVRDYLHAGDVFIMPSEQETFGLAIVEAAASGLPLVLRDIHDYDHTFRESALMCDDDTFASALVSLRTDEKLYREMVAKSASVAERFDSKRLSGELVRLYETVLTEN